MANENEDIKKDAESKPGEPKHESWIKHIIDEIKEEIAELTEEAQNMGGEFSVLGNGHINHVHNHRHDNDPVEEKKEEKKEEEK
jgi:hypothetical protein